MADKYMNNYPTKEKIMEEEQKFKPEIILTIKKWKKTIWKKIKNTNNDNNKYVALKVLANCLADIYNKPIKTIYIPLHNTCCYHKKTKTIIINNSTSIISLLHEFAHHLFGTDETKACKWSVWLFKKTFPISFKQLNWNGHMLKK